MEKVIHEVKIIETDDGFRIEIKGDKEKIKEFMQGFQGPGMWGRGGRHSRHRHAGPFPWMWHPLWMHRTPPWASWEDEEEDEGKQA
jgi:hypothetical protein